MAISNKRLLLLAVGVLLGSGVLGYFRKPSGQSLASKAPRPVGAGVSPVAAAGGQGSAQTQATKSAAGAHADLMQFVDRQATPPADQKLLHEAAALMPAMPVWYAQDAVVRSWPKYPQVKDALRADLAATLDLEKAPLEQLVAQAASMRVTFWEEEGPLSPGGYRRIFSARLLLEIAHERVPEDLAVSDDLVETISAAYPMDCYNPEINNREPNREVWKDLLALRMPAYEQSRREVANGRSFTWADFARAADVGALLSAADPAKATEAFDWALTQAGPQIEDQDARRYLNGVLSAIQEGNGVGFHIYDRKHGTYPHDYVYARRLPSFRGPHPDRRGITPLWRSNELASKVDAVD